MFKLQKQPSYLQKLEWLRTSNISTLCRDDTLCTMISIRADWLKFVSSYMSTTKKDRMTQIIRHPATHRKMSTSPSGHELI